MAAKKQPKRQETRDKKQEPKKTSPLNEGAQKQTKPGLLAKLTPKKVLIALGILAVAAAGVWGYFYFTGGGKLSADKDGPDLHITSPTPEEWYSSPDDKVSLEGTVTDKSGVAEVSWKTEKGEDGTASVEDDTFKAENIKLEKGDNKITVSAKDKKGNKSETELNVSYNKDVTFGEIKLNPNFLYKGESKKEITVNAEVEPAEGKTLDKVKLYEVKDSDKNEVSEMLDNGEVANGDDVPEDSVFSAKKGFESDKDEPISLRVGVTLSDESDVIYSAVVNINVLKKPSEAQVSKLIETNKDLNKKFNELKKDKSPQAAAQALLDYIQKSKKDVVSNSGISEDGTGVWWQDKETGILAGVSNFDEEIKGAPADNSSAGTKLASTPTLTPKAYAAPKKSKNEVVNTKALYLGPYLHDFKNSDDYHDGWQTIKNSKCPECQTTEKKDAEVKVDDFKTLSNYGLVMISSHGDTWFKGKMASGNKGAQVITYTDQTADLDSILNYLPDLLANRLAIGYGDVFVVLPSYVRAYNGTFPGSLVYVSACRSAYNGSLGAAFLAKGAKGYLGFSEYVNAKYAKEVAGVFYKNFMDKGKEAKESFDTAVKEKGANDKSKGYKKGKGAAASFKYWGVSDLKMGGKELQNAGFEEGLVGWQAEGDARAVSRLGSLKPQEGKRMAIISTGLGSVSDSNSSLIQKICGKEGKAKVSFKYNFVSEEPMEYVGSQYDDNFTVVVTIKSNGKTLLERTINNSAWIPIAGINFAGGDSTTFHTGWATVSSDLGDIKADDKLEIVFRVKDKGDSIYDSAALIDDIQLTVD